MLFIKDTSKTQIMQKLKVKKWKSMYQEQMNKSCCPTNIRENNFRSKNFIRVSK